MSVGVREWWQRFSSMPDVQRAKLLALILGCFVVGMLYALGGLSLYLRATFLVASPTRALSLTRPVGEGVTAPSQTPPEPGATTRATATAVPTLYPTVTPDLTKTAMAAVVVPAHEGAAAAPYYPPTPFPTPTAGPATARPTVTHTTTPETGGTPEPGAQSMLSSG